MRVVLDGRVINDHFPGIGRYVYCLVAALAELSPADTFVVLHTAGQIDQRFGLDRLSQHSNVELAALPARRGRSGRPAFGALPAQLQARRLLRQQTADLFHATYWWGPYWPGTPGTVLSLYDLIGLRLPDVLPTSRRLALSMAVRLALRSAQHVLTLSEWSKADLVAHHALKPEQVTVTPLAPDPAFAPAPGPTVAELRARLELPGRYVLYVGINKPHKNLATLIAAWPNVRTRDTAPGREPPALVLAGPWDARYDALRLRASDSAPADAIRFLGPIPEADLPALYTGASAFAFPSRYEGFGLPPLEAMACGTPVVAANATSLPEVVGDGGLLVPPDDVAAWSEALTAVLADSGLAAELRARGLDHAGRFTWRATAAGTLAAYGKVSRAARGRRT